MFSHHFTFALIPKKGKVLRCCHCMSLEHWASGSHLLKILMCLVNCTAEFITHKQPELSNHNHDEHDGREHRYKENFEVQLHQSDACRPVERLPGFEHGHSTSTTQDLRCDFPGKGAVEGDNGIIFLGQHRSLDTLERDVGWDDDENEDANANETDENHLQEGNVLGAAYVFIDIFVVGLVNKEEESLSHADRSLCGNSEDSGGKEDVPDGSP